MKPGEMFAASGRGPRRWRAPGAVLATVALALLAAWAWFSGLFGLGAMVLALQGKPCETNGRDLCLSSYSAVIDGLPLAGLSRNVSGLTHSAKTGTLFAVVNRPPEIVEISTDGEVLRRIGLDGASDVEGITHVGGDRFIVLDEALNRLSWIDVQPETTTIDLEHKPFFAIDVGAFSNMGFEGISWDEATGTLVVSQELFPVRVFAISGLDRSLAGSGLGISIRQWRPALVTGHPTFDLSSVTAHGPSGNYLLLSDMTAMLTEYSADGAPISLLPLWRGWSGLERGIGQPEGVAVGPDGAIYIVSEPNLFYRLERRGPTR